MSKFGNLAKDIYPRTLLEIAAEDKNLIVMEADLGKAVGSDVFKDGCPERHINVGIAEQDLVSTAAGLSEFGKIPFASTFSCFATQRACDQLVNVCYNKFNVKLVGSYSGLTSEKNGGTHISVGDIAITRTLPNLTVLVPGDASELEEAIRLAHKIQGPVYLRMAKGPFKPLPRKEALALGKGQILREGKDLIIIGTGIITAEGMEAAETLSAKGIEATVVHMPSIKPLDCELLLELAKRKLPIYTVENHSIYGGLGSVVAEYLSENAPTKVTPIGMRDRFGDTAVLSWLLEDQGISASKIAERIAKDYE